MFSKSGEQKEFQALCEPTITVINCHDSTFEKTLISKFPWAMSTEFKHKVSLVELSGYLTLT